MEGEDTPSTNQLQTFIGSATKSDEKIKIDLLQQRKESRN